MKTFTPPISIPDYDYHHQTSSPSLTLPMTFRGVQVSRSNPVGALLRCHFDLRKQSFFSQPSFLSVTIILVGSLQVSKHIFDSCIEIWVEIEKLNILDSFISWFHFHKSAVSEFFLAEMDI